MVGPERVRRRRNLERSGFRLGPTASRKEQEFRPAAAGRSSYFISSIFFALSNPGVTRR